MAKGCKCTLKISTSFFYILIVERLKGAGFGLTRKQQTRLLMEMVNLQKVNLNKKNDQRALVDVFLQAGFLANCLFGKLAFLQAVFCKLAF